MISGLNFNYERYSLWVRSSMAWSRNEPTGVIMTRIQGLGIIDAELYDINKHIINKKLENDLSVFDVVNIQSYLWVLGVYELFRMIDQKIKENPEIANENASKQINKAKTEFSRIRVPLAKLEPSNRFRNSDYAIPQLGANDEQLGWKINDNDIIYYRPLSDLAISTFDGLRLSNYQKNKF
jgi:hypothetical protein